MLTLGFSPLAFAFLCLILLAILLVHRRVSRRTVALSLAVAAIAGAGAAVFRVFPSGGVYPFNAWDLLCVLIVSALGALLAWQSPRGRVLGAVFVVWGIACLVAYLVPSPIGDNITRLRALVFPVMLLTAFLSHFRPRWLVVAALSAALAYNVVPYLMLIPYRSDGRSADSAFWSQAVDYVRTHGAGGYRVEVVPTASHWEAYWVPKADIALARGWYRQLDEADNSVLYGEQLSGQEYRAWLRSVGVRYVVRPLTKLDFAGATGEAALLDSGRSGLAPVLRTSQVVVYELPAATPILTGSNPSRITTFSHDRIAGASSAAGSYFLRVRYTPYWDVIAGDVCLSRGPNGMTTMSVRTPGPFVLSMPSSRVSRDRRRAALLTG